jgi:amidase
VTTTAPTDLAFAGPGALAAMVRNGETSARELVELYLRRIEALDPQLNAFRTLRAEQALAEADQVEIGADPRPLAGVPIAVKDDIDVAGEVTAWGTNARDTPAPADAEVVRRLREAGAVIIGKTNVPEMTLWPFTETATFGATRNPWDLQRTPGGSSGGSGAAVAAGLVGAALGSDGAGSIRIPSAWCGLFGLKPQRGRVSLAPRPRAWHGMSVDGIMTRRVLDTALFHDVASGSTEIDLDRPAPPEVPFSQAAATRSGPLRIAYSRKFPGLVLGRLDEQVARALEQTVELLRSLGHEVTERDPEYGNDAMNYAIARYMRGAHDDVAGMIEHPERLERRTRAFARLGGLIPKAVIDRSMKGEQALAARLNRVRRAAPEDRRAAGARRAVDAERGRGLGPVQRRVEPHRPARGGGPGRLLEGGAAAGGAGRRAARP